MRFVAPKPSWSTVAQHQKGGNVATSVRIDESGGQRNLRLRTVFQLATIALLTLIPRIMLAAYTYGASNNDIANYELVARQVLTGGTAYDLSQAHYPYPPP